MIDFDSTFHGKSRFRFGSNPIMITYDSSSSSAWNARHNDEWIVQKLQVVRELSDTKRNHYSIANDTKTNRVPSRLLIFCDLGASDLDGQLLVLTALKSCTRWRKNGAKMEIGGRDVAILILFNCCKKNRNFRFCMIIVTALSTINKINTAKIQDGKESFHLAHL